MAFDIVIGVSGVSGNSAITLAQAREAVSQQWKVQWEILHPGSATPVDLTNPLCVPYQLEDEYFKEPPSTRAINGLPQQWCRVTLRNINSGQVTLGTRGARTYQRMALVWVQIFGPVNQGMNALDLLADQVKKIIEGESFGGITPAGGAQINEVGDDGHWYEMAVVIPVTYYELK